MTQESSGFRILCFIPVRNCEATIAQVLEQFQGEIQQHIDEILVIDNRSTDQTAQLAKEELAKLPQIKSTLLENAQNYGLGFSHKIAFNYALENKYDYLLVLHGDGSTSVNHLLPTLQKKTFLKRQMVLSHRMSPQDLGINCILSLFASLVLRKRVKDFRGGPLNLYKVSAFLNGEQSALYTYFNDGRFRQYLYLFGIYHQYKIEFFPVPEVQARKSWHNLISQAMKSVALIVNFFLHPKKTILWTGYQSFFSHTYAKTLITAGDDQPKQNRIARPKRSTEFQFLDLKRMKMVDPFVKQLADDGRDTLGLLDLKDESILNVRFCVGLETGASECFKSNLLNLIKVYSSERILLDLNVDKILKSKQLFDFLLMCKEFKVKVHISTMNTSVKEIWEKYAPLIDVVTLTYELGSSTREGFLNTVAYLSQFPIKIQVNVISDPVKFYYCYGLYQQVKSMNVAHSICFQPYVPQDTKPLPTDHLQLLNDDDLEVIPFGAMEMQHMQLKAPAEGSHQATFDWFKNYGFTNVFGNNSDISFKQVSIDFDGEVMKWDGTKHVRLGSLFDSNSLWIGKTVAWNSGSV